MNTDELKRIQRALEAAQERIKFLEWMDSLRRDTLGRYAETLAECDMMRRGWRQS